MFCPMCGAPNEDDSIFCGNCGAVLAPEDEAVEAAVEASEESAAEMAIEAEAAEEPVEEAVEELWAEPAPEDVPVELPPVDDLALEPVPPPPPPPPAYPSPRTAAAPALPTSGLAIASLLLGIGGLTLLPLLGSVAAIIVGYMARSDIRRRPDQITGDGLALAGIVMGWIAVGLSVLGIVVMGGLGICGVCGALGAGNY